VEPLGLDRVAADAASEALVTAGSELEVGEISTPWGRSVHRGGHQYTHTPNPRCTNPPTR